MDLKINNTLVGFKIDYERTDSITGLVKEKIIQPVEKCIDRYKQEMESKIGEEVIIVADFTDASGGLIVKMYAYLA